MNAIYLLLILAVGLVVVAVGWFVWAVRTGQFDDLETPAVRVLFDDDRFDETESDVTEAEEPAAEERGTKDGHQGRRQPVAGPADPCQNEGFCRNHPPT